MVFRTNWQFQGWVLFGGSSFDFLKAMVETNTCRAHELLNRGGAHVAVVLDSIGKKIETCADTAK